ncbi:MULTISPECIES: hypothetical protein [Serratia]|nr:hypothetical protein [Serratia marcescens]MBH1915022.1 hypothetical protein [Serratia marcescens]MBH2676555.1 hypothetical protein [Serratia marcescens]HEO9034870.1 hypothetical protein [Serratia marcescens]
MDMTTLLLYTVAVAAVTIIPGPTMLLALNHDATKAPPAVLQARRCPTCC